MSDTVTPCIPTKVSRRPQVRDEKAQRHLRCFRGSTQGRLSRGAGAGRPGAPSSRPPGGSLTRGHPPWLSQVVAGGHRPRGAAGILALGQPAHCAGYLAPGPSLLHGAYPVRSRALDTPPGREKPASRTGVHLCTQRDVVRNLPRAEPPLGGNAVAERAAENPPAVGLPPLSEGPIWRDVILAKSILKDSMVWATA